jgi:hypothetical protein
MSYLSKTAKRIKEEDDDIELRDENTSSPSLRSAECISTSMEQTSANMSGSNNIS